MLAVLDVQRTAYGVTQAAREAGRLYFATGNEAAARAAAAVALDDHDVEFADVQLAIFDRRTRVTGPAARSRSSRASRSRWCQTFSLAWPTPGFPSVPARRLPHRRRARAEVKRVARRLERELIWSEAAAEQQPLGSCGCDHSSSCRPPWVNGVAVELADEFNR